MFVYKIIAERVVRRGITKAELARRIGVDDELLRRSLAGKRKIPAEEFVKLCSELELDLSDFKGENPRKKPKG